MKIRLAIICILLVLGLAVYVNTFKAGFQFDDRSRIVENPLIKSPAHLGRLWQSDPTRFLTNVTFALNYGLHKLRPPGYHLVNVFLHLLNSFLVFCFTRSLLGCVTQPSFPTDRHRDLGAILAALMFLVHPLQTAAVTYVIQRATLLATLWYVLALWMYVKSRIKENRLFYFLSLGCACAGLLCKPIVITLPLAVLLVEFCFLRETKPHAGRWGLRWLPYLLIMALLPVLQVLGNSGQFTSQTLHGLTGETTQISRPVYLMTQLNVLVTYLRLFLFPVNQNVDYDYPLAGTLWEFPTGVSLLILLSLLATAVSLLRRTRVLSFGILWFFITLSSESSIYPIADVIFEHRMYLPMVGLSMLLPAGLFYLFKNLRTVVIVGLLMVSIFAVAAFRRNLVWQDSFHLWSDALKKSPGKARPALNFGKAYLEAGDLGQALTYFNAAVELDNNMAEAYNNRGYIFNAQGREDLALKEYAKALDAKPDFIETYNNRGYLYLRQGKYAEALADFNRAIALRPGNEVVYNNRGNVYLARRQYDLAMADYDRAVQWNPDYAKAYHNRGTVYRLRGNYHRAVEEYTKALARDPYLAVTYYHRSLALTALQQKEAALADVRKAKALGYPLK